jgi:uncharacterized protein YeaO (DUF488 family)
MPISIVRLGSRRSSDEGLRIGTVRHPPRGVPKSEYARQNWYDVWLPALAPSAELLRSSRIQADHSRWRAFERRFESELRKPPASHLLDVLAALSHTANFSVGCYCADERFCHRSVIRRFLVQRGASVR